MFLKYLRHINDAISLKELLEDLRYAKRRGLRNTAKRVMRVFDEHQIPVTRIPQIFPEFDFKFSDFDSLNSIINVLTPDLLDRLSAHFFVNREWLDTGRGEIQQHYESGYDFESLYNLIQKYQDKENQWIVAYFVVEDGVKFVPANDHDTFGNLMVILEHTTMLNDHDDFEYKRYQPLYFGYWHYYKTRMIIKSLSLLFIQSQSILTQKGYFSKYLNDQIFQNRFAVDILNNNVGGWWHPDDYIFCNGKSAQQKDPVDASRMHDYLKKINYYYPIKQLRILEFLD